MSKHRQTLLAATLVVGVLCAINLPAQTVETRIGTLDFRLAVPTEETVIKLYDEMDFQRAVQSYL